jgi:uncharacterized protein YndB with AHSA1/START domain
MKALDHVLERTVTIAARRETVFRYFTDSERFAAWWGAGSHIEPRAGGAVHIRYPNGVVASGEVVEIAPVERVVFTYGYEGEGKPIAPGTSRVTITLEQQPRGTLLRLRHELPTAEARDAHAQGWRYHLAVFANVVAREQHAGAATLVDRFLAAWAEEDPAKRRAELQAVAAPDLSFRDAFSCTSGIDDLAAHIVAARVHMPGLRLERRGDVRQCQGTAVAEWVAVAADGAERGHGVSVFDLAPDGRFARVTGIWA